MTRKACLTCGDTIDQEGRGGRRKWCELHRPRRGADHRRIRAELINQVVLGVTPCCRCHRPLTDLADIDLDHTDGRGPNDYNGLAHARSCNRSQGAALGNRLRGLRRHGVVLSTTAVPTRPPQPPPDHDLPHPRAAWCYHESTQRWGIVSRSWGP
jgi:hypothetical protein